MVRKDKQKTKEYNKQYNLNNREQIKQHKKQYYLINKEKKREYDKQYNHTHKQQKKQYNEQYRQKNLEKIRLKEKRYNDTHMEQRRQYRRKNPHIFLEANTKCLIKLGKQFNYSKSQMKYALMAWRKTVKKQFGSYCSVCGSSHGLNAHHIFYKSKYPELSLNVNNGIPLCKIHHNEIHQLNH